MDQVGTATTGLGDGEDSRLELTARRTIAYVAAMTVWVLTLSLASQMLSPVTIRALDFAMAGLAALSVVAGVVISAQGWLKQGLRSFWRPTTVAATITLILATNLAVPIGLGRLFAMLLWFLAAIAIVIALMLRLSSARRRRDVVWLAVAAPLLLAVVGSTAGFRNMDALMTQVEAGNYTDKAEQALAKYRNDEITAASGAIVLKSDTGELTVVFPMVKGVPSKEWGLVYLDPASIDTWNDRQSNLESLYSVAPSTCEHLRDLWHWCLVY